MMTVYMCVACSKNFPVLDDLLVKCSMCSGTFHYQCSDIRAQSVWIGLGEWARSIWKCHACQTFPPTAEQSELNKRISQLLIGEIYSEVVKGSRKLDYLSNTVTAKKGQTKSFF